MKLSQMAEGAKRATPGGSVSVSAKGRDSHSASPT
jgi:hypothetical protein